MEQLFKLQIVETKIRYKLCALNNVTAYLLTMGFHNPTDYSTLPYKQIMDKTYNHIRDTKKRIEKTSIKELKKILPLDVVGVIMSY